MAGFRLKDVTQGTFVGTCNLLTRYKLTKYLVIIIVKTDVMMTVEPCSELTELPNK
jgi:hypothetical protein